MGAWLDANPGGSLLSTCTAWEGVAAASNYSTGQEEGSAVGLLIGLSECLTIASLTVQLTSTARFCESEMCGSKAYCLVNNKQNIICIKILYCIILYYIIL